MTQGSRPRTQKNPTPRTALPSTARGQGQECSKPRPRTQHRSDLQKKLLNKNKKDFAPKFGKFFGNFKRSPGKKMFSKFFSEALWRSSIRKKIGRDLGLFSTSQKIVLSSSRELAGFEANAKDFKLCPRGQGCPQGLHHCSLTNDIKLDDPKLRECAHFILCLVTLGCRPHSSAFLWH